MSIENLLEKVKTTPSLVDFKELISIIDQNYDFLPTAFQNGDTHNEAGQNSGSCKLFSFAMLQMLSKAQTLSCFGVFYRIDVLQNPTGTDHQNIRNFMIYGWDGVKFEGEALKLK
jgi:HopJ type III effector protein